MHFNMFDLRRSESRGSKTSDCIDIDKPFEFSVSVPERGALGLDLRARSTERGKVQRGAIVKGFKPIENGKVGYIEQDGSVRIGDVLIGLHSKSTTNMPFETIIELAHVVRQDPNAWPLTMTFRREVSVDRASTPEGSKSTKKSTFFSSNLINPAQDGNFNDKLQYFKGFFATKAPTTVKVNDIPEMPSDTIVDEMFRDLLAKRQVPDDVMDELIRVESVESKWKTIWAAQTSVESSDSRQKSPARFAESLVQLKWDNKGLNELENVYLQINVGGPDWTNDFIDSFGLDYLAMKLPDPSPFAIEYTKCDKAADICQAILRILIALGHFPFGIDSIISAPGLVQRILLCFHTDDAELKRCTLQLLGVVCYNSAEGHVAVLQAFDEYKSTKGEAIRFTALRDALKSARYSLSFKEDVLSFINIIVNKALELEDRLAMRQDFIALGMADYFEQVRSKVMCFEDTATASSVSVDNNDDEDTTTPLRMQLDNMEKQIEVFETFMEDDRKNTIYETTDLSDVTNVFETIRTRCVDEEVESCFVSILQQLLFIPADTKIGKELWAICEKTIRQITLLDEVDEFQISYDDRKALLKLRDKFSQLLQSDSDSSSAYSIGPVQLIRNEQQKTRVDDDEPESGESVDPAYEKYFKLKKMGMPLAHLELKMKADGLDPAVLDGGRESREKVEPVVRSEYDKYIKLKKMGMPVEQLELKMKAEGLDPTLVFGKSKTATYPPEYEKYVKLKKMGMPLIQLELKMKAEGLDPAVLNPKQEPEQPAVKDDPAYSKYFKLKKMGMPLMQLELKMKAEGLNPALLDTPDAPSVPVVQSVTSAVKPVVKKPRMRNLYWDSIKSTQGTIWEEIKQQNQSQVIDTAALETHFSVAQTPAATPKPVQVATPSAPVTRVTLIDAKRAYNIGIMLARFRVPYEEIKQMVLSIDKEKLNVEKVQALVQFAPTMEELQLIRDYPGDPSKLGDTERFFYQIQSIPRYKRRLECILAAWTLEPNGNELERLIQTITTACETIRDSDRLKKILNVILQIGNELNQGTSRSGSDGFHLSILVKLGQVKTVNESGTLMHFLATQLRQIDPCLLELHVEFSTVTEASRISTQMIQTGLDNLKKAAELIESELKMHQKSPEEDDRFQDELEPYGKRVIELKDRLHQLDETMQEKLTSIVSEFGLEVSSQEDFFSILSTFSTMLMSADRENERKRMARERKVRHEEAKKKRRDGLAKILQEGNAQDIVEKIRSKRVQDRSSLV